MLQNCVGSPFALRINSPARSYLTSQIIYFADDAAEGALASQSVNVESGIQKETEELKKSNEIKKAINNAKGKIMYNVFMIFNKCNWKRRNCNFNLVVIIRNFMHKDENRTHGNQTL